MAASSFTAQVEKWVAETKERAVAVRNESTQRVIEIMQEPGPSRARMSAAVAAGAGLGKVKKDGTRGVSKRAFGPVPAMGGGGRLPVDTGYLRASLVVSIGEALPAITEAPKEGGSHTWDASAVQLKLEGAELSDTITAAYTAAYARRIEYGFKGKDKLGRQFSQSGTRFVALAAQQWPQIVDRVCREARDKAGG